MGGVPAVKGGREGQKSRPAGPCHRCGRWVDPAARTLQHPLPTWASGQKARRGENIRHVPRPSCPALNHCPESDRQQPVVTKPVQESGFSWSKSGCVRVSFRSYPVNVAELETWLGAPGCGQAVLHSLNSEPDVHFGMTLGGFRCWKISYQ